MILYATNSYLGMDWGAPRCPHDLYSLALTTVGPKQTKTVFVIHAPSQTTQAHLWLSADRPYCRCVTPTYYVQCLSLFTARAKTSKASPDPTEHDNFLSEAPSPRSRYRASQNTRGHVVLGGGRRMPRSLVLPSFFATRGANYTTNETLHWVEKGRKHIP